eukprot:gene15605-biopygen9727
MATSAECLEDQGRFLEFWTEYGSWFHGCPADPLLGVPPNQPFGCHPSMQRPAGTTGDTASGGMDTTLHAARPSICPFTPKGFELRRVPCCSTFCALPGETAATASRTRLDASHTIEVEGTDAFRTRPRPRPSSAVSPALLCAAPPAGRTPRPKR